MPDFEAVDVCKRCHALAAANPADGRTIGAVSFHVAGILLAGPCAISSNRCFVCCSDCVQVVAKNDLEQEMSWL